MKKIALVGLAFPVLLATTPVVAVPAVQHTTAASSSKIHKLSKNAKTHKLTKVSKTHKVAAKTKRAPAYYPGGNVGGPVPGTHKH